jgi:DNA polymerase-1
MKKPGRQTLYVIDGSAYVHRSYHAIRALTSPDGRPTNAVFGFTRMLMKLLEQEQPSYLVVALDVSRKTFRTEIYPEYKATRKETPQDLIEQFPAINDVVRGFGIRMAAIEGFEADDIMGTLAHMATEHDMDTVLVTGDKDMLQLVNGTVSVYDAARDNGTTYTPAAVKDRFGVGPDRIPDIFGLWGDSSDNIPGVRGIGEKSSKEIIAEYGSLEAVYERIDEFKGARRKRLEEDKEKAFMSRDLARIRTDMTLDFDLEDCRVQDADRTALAALFKDLGFASLLDEYMPGIETRDVTYKTVQTINELDELVETLRTSCGFAVDTETTSVDSMRAALVGISVSLEPGTAYYIPVGHCDEALTLPPEDGELFGEYIADQLPMEDVLGKLRNVLEDPSIAKTGQNVKYDAVVLARHGIELAGADFDTMVASYLIDAGRARHNLDAIAARYLEWRKIPTSDIIGSGVQEITMDRVPVDKVTQYACEDADVTFRLRAVLGPMLDEQGLDKLFREVEMPLVDVLKRIEMTGILIDRDLFAGMATKLESELERLTSEVHELAGHPFNLNSPKQLQVILFEELGLQPLKRSRSGPSTDVTVLTQLALDHPLPAKLLEYRGLEKLRNTYVDVLPRMVHSETGRIHTSFNQTVAATGRLSSSNPNLQNIPVRTELGREIRRGFVPEQGWRFVSADYSQIELRVLAHLSRDKNLIEAFEQDSDIHATTAANIFGIANDDVTPELRRRAKAVNFGIIYGMSAFRLARDFDISRQEAQEFIDRYFTLYKGVKEYLDQSVETARELGFVSTLLGRRRYIPELNLRNRNQQQHAARAAVNMPVQGSSADIIKVAMVRLDNDLRCRNLSSRIVLQVHDELLLECPENEVDEVSKLCKEVMEKAVELCVPLKVDVGTGTNWSDAH